MATFRRRRGKSDGSLQKEKVAVTFAKGVDQVTAEKLVVPGCDDPHGERGLQQGRRGTEAKRI